ncbi:nuclear GTP-binding protein [Nematocida homosporus]|uniref:nuclear GTP-binding protein n=1 Tax=Nematocida homosporus TaxID=1912981 RepID=UPI00221FBC96|nr:nuclear GTP-binding protein [Nematocida homosporus]KAI5187554.1 nuclear GTP-binding protein [Nematocida homosporus]
MAEKGENFYRTKEKLAYWKMIRGGKPTRDAKGRIVKHAIFQNPTAEPGRIENSRSWFSSTRTTDQRELESFREDLANTATNAYKVILDKGKVPMSLIQEEKEKKIRPIISYADTFGRKATRKKVKLSVSSIQELASKSSSSPAVEEKESTKERADNKDRVYLKGQSRRIWAELYKVLDSSDVIVHILDSRDPLGTECHNIRKYLKDHPHKHLIYLLNKVDLLPTGVTAKWLAYFAKSTPTLAYHAASLDKNYGKQSLINLLRQFAKLHPDKKQISVGFVGYPNVGKSSVINTLKSKIVCTVAPIPGQTKVWQYISLMKRIYLIDCPGIVPTADKDETAVVLKGVVRVENITNPEYHIEGIFAKADPKHLHNFYGIDPKDGCIPFLEALAKKSGRLLKGGVPDISAVAKNVIHDWLRGRIPYYVLPPA